MSARAGAIGVSTKSAMTAPSSPEMRITVGTRQIQPRNAILSKVYQLRPVKPALRGKPLSERRKAALSAAEARRVKLGNPSSPGAVTKAMADERAKGLASTIDTIRAGGVTSANAIAGELNRREIATARGGKWSARSVLNVLARL
jgi:hypothetical protein